MRRCAGCGQRTPQRELLRIAAVDGVARVDTEARLPGRGVYACGPTCLERVANRRTLSRALRGQVSPPDDTPLEWPRDSVRL